VIIDVGEKISENNVLSFFALIRYDEHGKQCEYVIENVNIFSFTIDGNRNVSDIKIFLSKLELSLADSRDFVRQNYFWILKNVQSSISVVSW
jgi:hypothetical protein